MHNLPPIILRDTIGQAISAAIHSGARQADYCDPREINRLADAVIAALPAATVLPGDRALLQTAHDEITYFHGSLAHNDGKFNNVATQIRAALAAPASIAYPATLTPELADVLGLMNFQVCPIAEVYRMAGHAIETNAEAEQAFMLDRLIRLVIQHGAGWHAAYKAEVMGIRADLAAKEPV